MFGVIDDFLGYNFIGVTDDLGNCHFIVIGCQSVNGTNCYLRMLCAFDGLLTMFCDVGIHILGRTWHLQLLFKSAKGT